MGLARTANATERYRGQPGSLNQVRIRYCHNENMAAVEIPLTAALSLSPTDTSFVIPATDTSVILGIAAPNFQRPLINNNGVFSYRVNDPVSILEEGDITMLSEAPVKYGDKVFIRHTVNGAFTKLWTVSNAAGTGLRELIGGQFVESLAVPGLVKIKYINI